MDAVGLEYPSAPRSGFMAVRLPQAAERCRRSAADYADLIAANDLRAEIRPAE